MPTSDNAAVVWRYLQEVLGGGRLELLDELVAPTMWITRPGRGGGPASPGYARSCGCSIRPSLIWP
jgi:hypothetical protein